MKRGPWIEFLEIGVTAGRRLRWENGRVDGDPSAVAAFHREVRQMVESERRVPGPVPATYSPGWESADQFFATAESTDLVQYGTWQVRMSRSARRALDDAAWYPPDTVA